MMLFFKIGPLCSVSYPGAHSEDQASLEVTEICLRSARIKGMPHYNLALLCLYFKYSKNKMKTPICLESPYLFACLDKLVSAHSFLALACSAHKHFITVCCKPHSVIFSRLFSYFMDCFLFNCHFSLLIHVLKH